MNDEPVDAIIDPPKHRQAATPRPSASPPPYVAPRPTKTHEERVTNRLALLGALLALVAGVLHATSLNFPITVIPQSPRGYTLAFAVASAGILAGLRILLAISLAVPAARKFGAGVALATLIWATPTAISSQLFELSENYSEFGIGASNGLRLAGSVFALGASLLGVVVGVRVGVRGRLTIRRAAVGLGAAGIGALYVFFAIQPQLRTQAGDLLFDSALSWSGQDLSYTLDSLGLLIICCFAPFLTPVQVAYGAAITGLLTELRFPLYTGLVAYEAEFSVTTAFVGGSIVLGALAVIVLLVGLVTRPE